MQYNGRSKEQVLTSRISVLASTLTSSKKESSTIFTEPGQFAGKTDVFPAQCPSTSGVVHQMLSVKTVPLSFKNL